MITKRDPVKVKETRLPLYNASAVPPEETKLTSFGILSSLAPPGALSAIVFLGVFIHTIRYSVHSAV